MIKEIERLLIQGYSIPRIATELFERETKIKKVIKSNYRLKQIYINRGLKHV